MDDDEDDYGAETDEEADVREAHARFDRCVKWESQSRVHRRDDIRFANGDAYNMAQWDNTVQDVRGERPMLTNNKVRQHNLQICNDQRQHKTQGKVSPTGGEATYEAAKIFEACVRRIEAHSKAVDAYSTAGFHQVESGLGYVSVAHRFVSDKSFDQDIFIQREPNPFAIYIDPDAKDYDKADMRFAFKFHDMARDEFIAQYGKENASQDVPLDNSDDWDGKDHVRVCEYWRRSDKEDSLHLMDDLSVVRESDMDKGWKKANKGRISRSRPIATPQVEFMLIAGNKIIEREIWPGKYIPIVPWIGEETLIDNVMDVRGHTRALLDPQRIYNYASSAAVEFIALQTKTPYIAAAEAIEGTEEDWGNANHQNKSVLIYKAYSENGQPLQRPEREKPPVAAPAYMELMNTAKFEMMMVSGQYQENLGQESNAQSGVAIQSRQREGDNATYHYIDNHAKGVRQVVRIVVDMIPRIYDTARVIKIMAEDGTQSDVHVDPDQQTAHAHVMDTPNGPQPVDADQARQADNDPSLPNVRVIFNPSVGDYDVDVDVGPPFATQRQEAVNAMTQVLQAYPNMAPWSIDILAKNFDWPGADVLAERAKRMVPSAALGGPPPEVAAVQQQAAQHIQLITQQGQETQGELAKTKADLASAQQQLANRSADAKIKDYQAETDRLKAVGAVDPATLQLIVRQLYEQMMDTSIVPLLQHHKQVEDEINPPPPPDQPSPAASGGPNT